MNRKMQKILSVLLTICMLLTNAPFPALAVEDGNAGASTTNGSYVDGVWTEGGSGSVTYNVDGTNVTLSKTATPVEGQPNVFDITLRVETSTTTTTNSYYNAGAVVLVIDVSGSMDYCAECGSEDRHESDCPKNTSDNAWWPSRVTTADSRMNAAKIAAQNFLSNYAGDDPNATRMVAVVSFATSARTRLDWVNVAGGEGNNSYDQANNVILGLSADGGTNLDAGLSTARNLLGQSAVSQISSKNVIALTDGVPTYYGNGSGYGDRGSKATNDATAASAKAVRDTGATLYTVCFGVADDYTYSGGPTVGNFLRDSVASSGKAYNADNSSELYSAFAKITESITSGLTGSDWTATDPMADMIDVVSAPGGFTGSGDNYTWTLGEATDVIVNGNTTTYVYTVTYRITLDVQGENFVEGDFFPTNGPTYLNLTDGTKLEFPVPGVSGVLPRTDVSITKVWDDKNNQDGVRKDSVKVQLKDGEGNVIGEPVVLNADNNWSYTWDGETYNLIAQSKGQYHVYVAEELEVPDGYEVTYDDSNRFALVVKNSHETEKKDIIVTKVWNDKNNQDGIRPATITVNLLADGEVVATAELTAETGWTYTFSGFDVYKAGVEIVYTVEEAVVPEGYEDSVDGLVITNTHTTATVDVPVTKIWDDNNNQDGIRPQNVTFALYADGVDTGKTLVISGTSWTGVFTGLDKYSNGHEIVYTVQEINVPEGYTAVASGTTVTNSHTPAVTEVSGHKIWVDNDNQDGVRPESITVHLMKNGEVLDTVTVTEADGWAWSFTGLPKYENGELIAYSVLEDAVDNYSASYNGYNITNTHTPAQTSVTVTKAWNDSNDQDGIRPNDVTVKLLANGVDTGKTLLLSSGNNWTGSFTGLDKFAAGVEIVYSVAEVTVDGYTTAITGSQASGYTITNTHAPETVDISGHKTWVDNDNQDGFRPESITINLLKNGEIIDTITVTEADGWAWSFVGLPKYENHGTLINYSISENTVEDYSTSYNGFNVTNTHTPEQTSVTVTKSWQDNNDQDGIRPNDITVELVANGEPTGKTLVLSDGNNWTDSFTGLDKYENGTEIIYTVAEIAVIGYETVVTGDQYIGYTVTNSHTPETVMVAGSKTWVDNDNQDGFRPESITINLLKNGEIIDTVTVTEADGWAWSFVGLPKYENHGTLITYSITENGVAEYTTTYNGFNVTNTHTPEQTSVTVTKSWKDNNDQDGIRPNDITVTLLANGEDTGKTMTLNDGNGWTGSFTDLDVYENGKVITYTVEELAVEGYETVITGDQSIGFTITNSHTPETVEVSGHKTWNDNNNQDGFRPGSITIHLLKNGEIIDTKVVTEADGWAWSFTNLPKYENYGTLINYSITEDAVEDYSTTINGYNVVNDHTPEQTSVIVSKSWLDNSDQDGIRPNDITVTLLANGADTGKTLVLNEGNNWTGSFTALDKYENGEIINYTVAEIAVEGYSTVISGDQSTGYTITNSHTPETVSVAGSKTWDDNNDQDGFRPDTITIHLHADGQVIDTKVVSAEDNWSWSFDNLPKYRDHGVAIVYTVTEDVVADYSTTINGSNVVNTHTPEKTSVTVTKSWKDNDDQDGIRPNSITIELVANGDSTGKTLVLNDGNSWTGTFTELDKYEAGQVIAYTVAEVAVEGYSTVITGDQNTGYTVTNSHTPETVEVSGHKTWNDNNNQDGFRPESITIHLLKNGEIIDTITVTEADGWAWSFKGLPKYENHGTLINYSITEDAVEDYSTTINGYNVVNDHTPEQTSVIVTKSWQDNNDQDGIRPNDITVTLLANGEPTGKTLVLNEGNNWTGSFTALDKYENGEVIIYTVSELSVAGYNTVITGDQNTGYTITNSHTPETISISGVKTWNDNNDQDGKRPESITIHLLADGQVVDTKVVSAEDNWSWTFENLPKYKDHGIAIVYTVTEDAVDEYVTEYSGTNVVNTHTIEKTAVSVTKSWVDNNDQDGIRPNDITIELVANGEPTGKTLVLSQGNNWTGTFTDLDKYLEGEVIAYSVVELKVDGYESVITGDQNNGYTITNSHTPETVEVSGTKTWNDNNNQDGFRPESITIHLLKNGEIIDTKVVTEADGWSWSFTNLPKYENHGTLITYSITEEGIEDYSTSYNGFNVVNTHTPEKTSVTVTKSWQDNNDQDGIRPNDITVTLLANGENTGLTLILNEGNSWTGSFTELDKYENGKVITYTVAEIAVAGYNTVITGDQILGYTITNSHTPEVVEVAGAKTWNDADNQDGFRPESITIHLLADGVVIDTITVTEAEGWAWSFENLPKYKDHGTLINYSITEEAIEDYTTTYNGYDVVNTHTPEKTSVTVTKAWSDNDDQDGIRPNDVTVILLANGVETSYTLTLNQGNNWTDSFVDLDKYENGEIIVYTVTEVEIPGYTAVITGDQTSGYTITNSHTPETVSFFGEKTWDDNDNQDGFRPESITINLLANGKVIKSVTVTEEDGWKWIFENLPKYENHGSLIYYTITENAVEGYSTIYDGYDVTNVHTPEEISLTVTKSWADNNDQDGIRPDEITVVLLADGVPTGETLVLSAEDNWTGSFIGLDKYADGVEIVYTIDEVAVEGYETVISGDMTTGYVITNSHTPETISISGTKTWEDADNQDGVRPESIVVNLMANGQIVQTATVTEAENWSYTFENLPKYENGGVEIIYAITEEAVEGYTTTYDGYDIINSYTPAEISLTVTKAWADSDNEDGLRPNKITIVLYADGEKTDITLVLTAEDNWSGSFVGLPKYANGVEIVYTIGEVAVEGYNTVIRGDMASGFVVTNSHTVIPQTGDERTPILWMFMMFASVAAAAYVCLDSKKKRNAK